MLTVFIPPQNAVLDSIVPVLFYRDADLTHNFEV